jgi:hypothetical protein
MPARWRHSPLIVTGELFILSDVTILAVFAYRSGETANGFTTGIINSAASVLRLEEQGEMNR